MRIILLTHEREILRKNGTGKIVQNVTGDNCSIIEWKRKEPSILIKKELSEKNTLLVYPGDEESTISDISGIENFILLDGTWQEARKIYNKSPYLKRFRSYKFSAENKSSYTLRRNQKETGLCTVESVIELYKLKGDYCTAEKLNNAFNVFQKS